MIPSFLSDCSHFVSPGGFEEVPLPLCKVLKETDDKDSVSLVPSVNFLCRYEERVFDTISCHSERGNNFSTSPGEQAFWIFDNNKAGSGFEDNSEHFPPQTGFWMSQSLSLSGIARTGAGEASPDAIVLSGDSAKSSDVAVNRDVGIVLSEYILGILIYFNQLLGFVTIYGGGS